MSKRRDRLKELLSGVDIGETAPGQNKPSPASVTTSTSPKHRPSGAVRAMGLSLDGLKKESEIEVITGVQSLDPALIEPALVSDRLSDGAVHDPQFEELKKSIQDGGQQVPVLVRPHPDKTKRDGGLFQAAYGHRRIKAAQELRLNVDAVVRELSDDELVLAQGRENGDRRDLSFIERAYFAKGLADHGIDRATVQSALGVHKSEMTRLLQVAEAIPIRFVRAIGPAPKIGRPRWLALGDLLSIQSNIEKANNEIAKSTFEMAVSDERFKLIVDRLSKPQNKVPSTFVKTKDGRALAEKKGRVLTLNKAAPDGFADYLAQELPSLLTAFEKKN
ncbi:MAG: plasmid partitioning protein RepB [Hyphomicrobiales bacterium]